MVTAKSLVFSFLDFVGLVQYSEHWRYSSPYTCRRECSAHGRRSRGRGQGGQVPPPKKKIWTGADVNANCPPPRFCHIGTKMSVLWPSKYAKIRFRSGLCPGPRWGSSRRSPRPLSRLERGHPSPYSARTHLRRSPCVAPRSPARSTPMAAQFVVRTMHHNA